MLMLVMVLLHHLARVADDGSLGLVLLLVTREKHSSKIFGDNGRCQVFVGCSLLLIVR